MELGWKILPYGMFHQTLGIIKLFVLINAELKDFIDNFIKEAKNGT